MTYRATQSPASGKVRVAAISDTPVPSRWSDSDLYKYGAMPDYFPYGEISMTPAREVPNFQGRDLVPSYGYREAIGLDGWDDEEEEAVLAQRPPTELFTHVSPQLKEAFVDPAIRHVLPTMVGIAMKKLNAEHDVPMADQSLTRWSSELSQNAVKRGLAVPHPTNPTMDVTSDYNDHEIPRNLTLGLSPDWHGSIVPQEDVRAGQQWVRSRLRNAKAVRGESQFDPLSQSQREWQGGRTNPGQGQGKLF